MTGKETLKKIDALKAFLGEMGRGQTGLTFNSFFLLFYLFHYSGQRQDGAKAGSENKTKVNETRTSMGCVKTVTCGEILNWQLIPIFN